MTKNYKLMTVLFIMVLVLGFVAPQPAQAGVWDSVKSVASSAVSSVKSTVSSAVDTVKSTVSSVVSTATSAVSGAVSAVKGAYDSVKGAATGVMNSVKGVASGVMDSVKGLIGGLTGEGKAVVEKVKEAVDTGIKEAASAVQGAAGAASGGLGGFMDKLGNISQMGGALADKLKEKVGSITGILKEGATNGFSKVTDAIGEFKEFVTSNGITGADGMVQKFADMSKENLSNLLKNDPSKLLGDMISGAKAGANPILAELTNLGDKLKEKGMDFTKFVADKGSSVLGTLKAGATKIFVDGKEAAQGAIAASVQGAQAAMRTINKEISNPVAFQKSIADKLKFNTTADVASVAGFNVTRDGYASANLLTGSNISGGAMDEGPKKNQESIILDAHLGLRGDISGKIEGDNYSVTANARAVAGLSGYGEGSLKWMKDGTLVQASARAEAVAGLHGIAQASANAQLSENFGAKGDVYGSVMVGAGARAKGKVYAGDMGVEIGGNAEARVGAWVDGEAKTSLTYQGESLFSAKGSAGAGLGVGAGIGGGASLRLDKIGFEGSITLGPVKLGGGVYVNPKAVAHLAFDKGKEAAQAVGNVANKVGDAVSDRAQKIGSGAKKLWNSFWD
jgi:hypothetical protein